MIFSSLDKLWKLDGTKLINKAKVWKSTEDWKFINEGTKIYIGKTSHFDVLGMLWDDKVGPQAKDTDNDGQLWIKGKENFEGYFTLENSKSFKFLTAISANELKVEGNIEKKPPNEKKKSSFEVDKIFQLT